MVYYFTSTVTDPPTTLYMGKDKHENELLIEHGIDTDIWFHVEKLSSAHVYLRMNSGGESTNVWTGLEQDVLVDCAQLCKANSIEGNKRDNITVIYTPWSNLLKNGSMDVGQVSFKDQGLVRKVFLPERLNSVVNRLIKTREERFPDLGKDKILFEKARRAVERVKERKEYEALKALDKERKELKEQRSYSGAFDEDEMHTNKEFRGKDVAEVEDDFM